MTAHPPALLTIGDTAFQYETEPDAGVYLSGDHAGERWHGTRVRWRPGTVGRWRKFLLVDVHPFEQEKVEQALRLTIAGGAS